MHSYSSEKIRQFAERALPRQIQYALWKEVELDVQLRRDCEERYRRETATVSKGSDREMRRAMNFVCQIIILQRWLGLRVSTVNELFFCRESELKLLFDSLFEQMRVRLS